jgi:hypothetical protein
MSLHQKFTFVSAGVQKETVKRQISPMISGALLKRFGWYSHPKLFEMIQVLETQCDTSFPRRCSTAAGHELEAQKPPRCSLYLDG